LRQYLSHFLFLTIYDPLLPAFPIIDILLDVLGDSDNLPTLSEPTCPPSDVGVRIGFAF
jgi:hypothetical protein